jgi:hypothetical protein
MGIDLHMCMTEDHLGVLGGDVELFRQRRRRVPKVKNLDHADLVVIADTAERARQVPRLDRQAAACTEDKAGVLPGPAESFPVSGLFVLAGNQWVSPSSDTVVVGGPRACHRRPT